MVLIGSRIFKNNKITKIALYCLAAYYLSIVLIMISKTFYPSPRPFIGYEAIRLVVHDNGFYSFPSGHFGISTTVLTVIILIADKYKRELIVISLTDLLILSFVNIYGGVHYPIDVIGGGIIGIMSATSPSYFVFRSSLTSLLLFLSCSSLLFLVHAALENI